MIRIFISVPYIYSIKCKYFNNLIKIIIIIVIIMIIIISNKELTTILITNDKNI